MAGLDRARRAAVVAGVAALAAGCTGVAVPMAHPAAPAAAAPHTAAAGVELRLVTCGRPGRLRAREPLVNELALSYVE
jgi:hypothetical protein